MTNAVNKNRGGYEKTKVKGFTIIPSEKEYMCVSIRKYYFIKEFTKNGYTKEYAELIANQFIQ